MLLSGASSFYFPRNRKKLTAQKLSIKMSMLLMMLPVTNSADFEQTIGEVFIAKFCRKSTNNNTFDY